MDDSTIQRLKDEHGEVYILTADDAEVVVRMPSIPEFDRFMASMGDEKKSAKGLKQLVRDVLVHPSREDFDAIVSRRPGIFLSFAKEVAHISGATVEAEAKKG